MVYVQEYNVSCGWIEYVNKKIKSTNTSIYNMALSKNATKEVRKLPLPLWHWPSAAKASPWATSSHYDNHPIINVRWAPWVAVRRLPGCFWIHRTVAPVDPSAACSPHACRRCGHGGLGGPLPYRCRGTPPCLPLTCSSCCPRRLQEKHGRPQSASARCGVGATWVLPPPKPELPARWSLIGSSASLPDAQRTLRRHDLEQRATTGRREEARGGRAGLSPMRTRACKKRPRWTRLATCRRPSSTCAI